jgi:hypothetical protein
MKHAVESGRHESPLQHNFDFCFAFFPVPGYVYSGSAEQRLNLERTHS